MVSIICELRQFSVQNKFASHLLSQKPRTLLELFLQSFVRRLLPLLRQNVSSSDLLLECFVQLVYLLLEVLNISGYIITELF
jgi:hypothetical protein